MEELVKLLEGILPGRQWKIQSTSITGGSMDTVELPPAPSADYFFKLHSYPDGEKCISAQLLSADPEAYFWYQVFELPDYKSDSKMLDQDFLATVETLLTRETMILQKKGVLWHTFRLAYRVGDQARVLSSESGLRLSFAAPPIMGRRHTYCSGPLGKDRSMDPEPAIRHGRGSVSLFAASSREL